MREMKASGISWLGELPSNWELRKIKYCLQERVEKNNPVRTTEILSLTAKQGVIPYDQKEGGGNKPKEDVSAYRLAYPGDIVMNSMNILSGSVGLSQYFGCVSPVYYMLRPWNAKEDVRYYNYIFQTTMFQRSLFGLGNGILIKESGNGKLNTIRMRIPMDKFGGLFIPVAPTGEQHRIADFLDAKCAEIDVLTTDIQTQIDTLEQYKRSVITETVTKGLNPDAEMKDSGIQWIGNMPSHWEVIRGKYILRYMQKPVRDDDGVITCFRDGEVTLRSNRREDGFTMSDKEIGYQGIDIGDLVVHGMDGFAGAIGISDSRGKASPVLNVLDTNQNKRYIMYYLRSMAYSDVFLALATGIRVRSCDLRWNKLADLSYPVPPLDEQKAIGEVQDYTLYNDNGNKRRIFQNFLDAKAGDMIIGYESTPVKQVVAILKISAEQDGKSIYFEKVEGLSSPIDYATLKACPELEKMEYFGNPQGSLFKLTKGEYDFIYDMIRDENPAPPAADSIEKYDKEKFLNDVYMTEAKYERLVAVLKKKKNIILQGAPGVGKTFAAKRLAYSIMGEKDDDRIEFVQFHQNYSYEDFMMGYKPVEDGFELKYGIFYRFCQKAANHPDKDYFFIIDEINRGNMSKIFGELLMLIEADYRDTKATLAYNGLSFSVPKRLHIIGMMNTADRSLAMIDYALRRRFSFFDMEPGFDSEGFIKYQEGFANDTFNTLIDRIKELNQEIAKDKSLGKGFCIGHSYFCNTDECTEEWMQDVVDFDVLPMLAEYWFDDTDKLQRWENILHGVFQ